MPIGISQVGANRVEKTTKWMVLVTSQGSVASFAVGHQLANNDAEPSY